ncbi:branched-chain amino acid transport system II carrier protein [Anaerotignum propionicum]|uniref:branched-chain amino acid transport system II carrier protein n=1 Tax=Anaerotignum propionicum TaxID=28446 RepID=UPI00210B79D7|nr:branched-chain amino acid transport system II carrier protein [Anaerotignum propionicum]MCQ4935506.1 branched-chain amino acid transport system II carrier protein [Anaerotignum propionicum]
MNGKKNNMADVAVIGLALFAMFFGAGNLIFPPYLGINAGSEWFLGFICFFIADVGLALVAILAMIKTGDVSMNGITGKLGRVPSVIINSLIVLCIGPFLAIPRTAATTFEMGVLPIFPNFSSWAFGAIFFGLTLAFTIRPSSVIDVIGKYLTPILVLSLLALIVMGIVNPIGPIVTTTGFNTVKEGILSGYQTMDVLASVVFIIIIISAARDKGYTETKSTMKVVIQSSVFAAGALMIIYGGLAYLGATTSGGGFEGLNQTGLVVAITQKLVGSYGVLMLGIIVFFACLTTAIGLVSSCASFFEELTHGKASYKMVVIITVGFSYFVSNFGISTIISIAAPILTLLYPVVLVMIILTFFGKNIKNNNIYIGAAVFALLISAADVLCGFGLPLTFVKSLPLADFQCGWVIPAIIGGLIGKFIPMSEKAKQTSDFA